jgi:hypothetical protein
MNGKIKQEQVCEGLVVDMRYAFDEHASVPNTSSEAASSVPDDAGSSRTNLAPLSTRASWDAVE